ncbi:MAG TPA: ribonuclease E inhibitor RraB [Pedobacter sp.]|nr:ribonuclease E inhibitor RraB [Pedobacter sp.]
MGLFDFLKPKSNKGQFISEDSFIENRSRQMQMTPQVIEQLRTHDVSADKALKLEYFFYTNVEDKAASLAAALEKLDYSVEYGLSEGDSNSFVITGWTIKMLMDEDLIVSWTKEMCELGYEFDCEFDGWGTDPDQD